MAKKTSEGELTENIENITAQAPSSTYLIAAAAAMGISLALKCAGRKHSALFIGQWAAPILLMGIYNKLVKQQGHDQEDD